MVFIINRETKRNLTAVEASLERILGHATGYLFSQINRNLEKSRKNSKNII